MPWREGGGKGWTRGAGPLDCAAMFGRKATQIHDPFGGPPPKVAKIAFQPPLIFLGSIVVGTALHTFTRGEGWNGGVLQIILGILIGAAGIALSMWSIRQYQIADTSPDPREEAKALIDTGPYARSRNPLYVAMALMQVGLGTAIDEPLIVWLVLPALFLIRHGVIAAEEKYLEEMFGDQYLAYRKRVRRWF